MIRSRGTSFLTKLFFVLATAATNLSCGPGLNLNVTVKNAQGICLTAAGLTGVPYAGGTGTSGNPYVICTGAQLNAIGQTTSDWSKSFILMNDIDMSAYTGTSYNVIGNSGTAFTGNFNGNSHTVANLYYYNLGANGVGLFGFTNSPATITNVSVTNVNLTAQYNVAALIGQDSNGTVVTNCSSSGIVTGPNGDAGGLIGTATNTQISNCHSQATVNALTSQGGTGGLVGNLAGATITASYATGSVHSTYSTGTCATGGLVGFHNNSTITSCYASATVLDDGGGTGCATGGLIGTINNGAALSNSYSASTVTVNTTNGAGGLVGSCNVGSITDCYAAGSVAGSSTTKGGNLAINTSGTYTHNFYDQSTTGQSSSADGSGSTLEGHSAMLLQTTFTAGGWDFASTWKMSTGGYPVLQWQ